MPSPTISGIWDRGIGVLNSAIDSVTKTILLQLGDEVSGTSESGDVESWGPSGFWARPSKPTAGQPSAQALVLKGSDRDACIGVRDTRCQSLYGSLNFGEFCLAAPGETATAQGRILGKADGSVTIYTTDDNTASGLSSAIYNGPDKIQISNKYGAFIIDASGITLRTANGVILTLGSILGLPVLIAGVPNPGPGQLTLVTGTFSGQWDTGFLGKLATPVTNLHYGPVPVASLPSVTNFVAP